LSELRREFLGRRMVTVTTAEETPRLELPGVEEVAREPYRLTLAVDTQAVSVERVVVALLDRFGIRDLMIENPPLEEVIKAIYRDSARAREKIPA
jgi:ABC-2 type transport system ATP-binding protein